MVDHQQQQQPQHQPPWEQIGSSFVHHYYKMFDTDRGQLASLYVSMPRLRLQLCALRGIVPSSGSSAAAFVARGRVW